MDVESIAKSASRSVLRQWGRWASDDYQLFQDMVQAAALKLLRLTPEHIDKGERYIFRVAYYAAIEEWFAFVSGWRDHDGRKSYGEILPLMDWIDRDNHEIEAETPFYESDDFQQRLEEMLLSIRQKRGERGASAAARDAAICILAMRGCTNREIADILGIPQNSVQNYRKLIRQALREKLNPPIPQTTPVQTGFDTWDNEEDEDEGSPPLDWAAFIKLRPFSFDDEE